MPAKNLHRVAEGGTTCHVYNKGIENRNIFVDEADYQAFISYLQDYLCAPKAPENTKTEFTVKGHTYKGVPHQPKNYHNKVELIAYSLKPDHFHLVLHQKAQKSLQAFLRSLCTRYSIYFNKKYNRTGPLFEGPYKSVQVKEDQSLFLLTAYLHKEEGGCSSKHEFQGQKETSWVKSKFIQSDQNNGLTDDKHEPNLKEKELLNQIIIENHSTPLARRDLQAVKLKPWARIPELVAAGAVFALLLGIGLKNVTTVSNAHFPSPVILGTSTSPASASPSPITQAEAKVKVSVKTSDGPLIIRKQPTVQSEKIGQAQDGDILELVSKNSDWSEVKLPNNSTGFINSKYIQIMEGNQSNE